jgi:hypothetical protein
MESSCQRMKSIAVSSSFRCCEGESSGEAMGDNYTYWNVDRPSFTLTENVMA